MTKSDRNTMAQPLRYSLLLLALLVISRPFTTFAQAPNPLDLYYAGKVGEARLSYEAILKHELEIKDPERLWQSYMAFAWFEEQVGRHSKAIELSNQALSFAVKLRDSFRIGRSLCWLGWSYQSMGLYDLALQFFKEAKALGEKDGQIVHVAVWGLATQEIGALYFKMGDLEEANKYLDETFSYARDNNIQVGVAEGGRHLAEIALAEGELERAKEYADAAVQGARKCNCSPLNTTRALVTRGRVLLELSKRKQVKKTIAVAALDEALAESEKTQNLASIAEAKLLLSRVVDKDDFSKRYQLVSDAVQLLGDAENELRGSAEAELGTVFVANKQLDLARFYLENGFQINQELFRTVDNAYVLAAISDLEKVGEKEKRYLQVLGQAANQAEAVGMLSLAIEKELELAEALVSAGYDRLAIKSSRRVLELSNRALEKAEDLTLRAELERARIQAKEIMAEYGIERLSAMPAPQ